MITKVKVVISFSAGYLLGSKAGRPRYEQIMAQAAAFARQPSVRRTVDKAQTATERLPGQAGRSFTSAMSRIAAKGRRTADVHGTAAVHGTAVGHGTVVPERNQSSIDVTDGTGPIAAEQMGPLTAPPATS